MPVLLWPLLAPDCDRERIRRVVDQERIDLSLREALGSQRRDELGKHGVERPEVAAAGFSDRVPTCVMRDERSL
jgi:hypothetical protein